jgi:hypothetical protein
VIELDPNHAGARNNLGILVLAYKGEGKNKEAIGEFIKVLSLPQE